MMRRTTDPPTTDALVALMSEAASAYIAGEMRHFFDLIRLTDDFTLMSPFGGEVARETSSSMTPERMDELEDFFRGGECELEVVETYASGDLAVLVAVEHQHGVVGHLPDQDWSLRVTLVFRRDQDGWRMAHRHADPLVRPITFDRLAELARA